MTHPRRTTLSRLLAAALMGASVCAALAANPRASQQYEDALARFERKDYAGTVVQLKNVLKADNKNLAAQVLLGKALLEDRQIGAAEVAFTEALRLGVNRAEVVLPLARTMVEQGQPQELMDGPRFSLDGLPAATRYQLLLLRAGAAVDLSDLRAAMKAVEDARALDATDPGSWIAEVPVRIRTGQFKEALAAADRSIALAPTKADAHFGRGEALHVVPELKGALASYDKALALQPEHVGALVARAGAYLDFNRVEDAARDIAALGKNAARDPRATYLKALVAERQGRADEARAALNELTGLLDPIPLQQLRYRPQTQMLGGMAHYSLGQREKAKPYLEGVLRAMPGHPVSKVLANIHLADRNFDSAIETLDAYLRKHPGDSQAKLLLASAHMSQGRHARATQIMQEALKGGEQPQLRTTLGLSLVGGGKFAEASKELERVFAKDPKQLQAGYALGSLYVQSGQAANAVRVIDQLAKAHPRNAGVLHLQGLARRLKGDMAGARTAFEAAAQADHAFMPAQMGLARLDMDAKAWPAAAKRLNEAFAKDDKNPELLSQIAEVSERTGRLPDAQRWLQRAEELSGANNAGPALALIDFHLRHNQLPEAREAVLRAQLKAPDAVQTLVASARVSLAGGDAPAARTSLTRAANTANYNPPLLTQIALLQTRAGAPQAAAYSLDKALGDRPDYLPALALRAEVDIQAGDLAKAEQRARQILVAQPRLGLGHALLGDVARARKQPEAAVAAYRKAHELDKSSESAMRLFGALVRQDPPGAVRMGEQWLTARPGDTSLARALADTHLSRGNLAGARRQYESLLKQDAANVDVLNNLANVMTLQNDAGALQVAEQALALAPTAAHVIGTTGWAAFKAGQADRSMQLLRDARLRDPGNADTRYFLASVLAQQGRPGEARTELTAALQGASGLSYRPQAEALLATLK